MSRFSKAKAAIKKEMSNAQHQTLNEDGCDLAWYVNAGLEAYTSANPGKVKHVLGRRYQDHDQLSNIIDRYQENPNELIFHLKEYFESGAYYRGGLGRSYLEDCINAAIFLYHSDMNLIATTRNTLSGKIEEDHFSYGLKDYLLFGIQAYCDNKSITDLSNNKGLSDSYVSEGGNLDELKKFLQNYNGDERTLINVLSNLVKNHSDLFYYLGKAIDQFVEMQSYLTTHFGKQPPSKTNADSKKEFINSEAISPVNDEPKDKMLELQRNLVCKRWLPPQKVEEQQLAVGMEQEAPKKKKKKNVILALHGFDDSVETWAALVKNWTDQGFEVISYDQAGHGSDELRKHNRSLDLTQMQYDFYHKLQTLQADDDIGEIHLVGHDIGGALLTNCMATIDKTKKVETVTCISPPVMKNATLGVLSSLPTQLTNPGDKSESVKETAKSNSLQSGGPKLLGSILDFIYFVANGFKSLRTFKPTKPWLIISDKNSNVVSVSNFKFLDRLFSKNKNNNITVKIVNNVDHFNHSQGNHPSQSAVQESMKNHINPPKDKDEDLRQSNLHDIY